MKTQLSVMMLSLFMCWPFVVQANPFHPNDPLHDEYEIFLKKYPNNSTRFKTALVAEMRSAIHTILTRSDLRGVSGDEMCERVFQELEGHVEYREWIRMFRGSGLGRAILDFYYISSEKSVFRPLVFFHHVAQDFIGDVGTGEISWTASETSIAQHGVRRRSITNAFFALVHFGYAPLEQALRVRYMRFERPDEINWHLSNHRARLSYWLIQRVEARQRTLLVRDRMTAEMRAELFHLNRLHAQLTTSSIIFPLFLPRAWVESFELARNEAANEWVRQLAFLQQYQTRLWPYQVQSLIANIQETRAFFDYMNTFLTGLIVEFDWFVPSSPVPTAAEAAAMPSPEEIGQIPSQQDGQDSLQIPSPEESPLFDWTRDPIEDIMAQGNREDATDETFSAPPEESTWAGSAWEANLDFDLPFNITEANAWMDNLFAGRNEALPGFSTSSF